MSSTTLTWKKGKHKVSCADGSWRRVKGWTAVGFGVRGEINSFGYIDYHVTQLKAGKRAGCFPTLTQAREYVDRIYSHPEWAKVRVNKYGVLRSNLSEEFADFCARIAADILNVGAK